MTALQTLKAWLVERDMTQTEFAGKIGRSRPYVSQLLNGKAKPGLETGVSIQRVTRGRVRAADWFTNGGAS